MPANTSITRLALHALLGGWPTPRPAATGAGCQSIDSGLRDDRGSMRVHSIAITPGRCTPQDSTRPIPATLTLPPGKGPFPAVLYIHAHGHDYALGRRELLEGRAALPSGPYAEALAVRGIAALCIDLPAFGDRSEHSESSLTKRYLWHGDTLFGAMLRELATALDWLEQQEVIASDRIATLGISMGSTLGWWLAALDDRVQAVAQTCCLADIATLVALDAHDAHGIYMMVPGLLDTFKTADIAGLICPRAHLVGIGELDALTPPLAVAAVLDPLQRQYCEAGSADALRIVRSADTGHVETPRMRKAVLEFLEDCLLADDAGKAAPAAQEDPPAAGSTQPS